MQLHLRKNQATKFFGGVKFELQARVTLTEDEDSLVNKYRVQDEVLVEKQIKIPFTDRALLVKMTIGSLVAGQTLSVTISRRSCIMRRQLRRLALSFASGWRRESHESRPDLLQWGRDQLIAELERS